MYVFVFRFLLNVLKTIVLGGGTFTGDPEFRLHKTAKTWPSKIISYTVKCDPYSVKSAFGCQFVTTLNDSFYRIRKQQKQYRKSNMKNALNPRSWTIAFITELWTI